MSDTKNKYVNVRTPPCILVFHDLFVPKAIEQGKEPTYNVTLAFTPEMQASADFQDMKAKATQVAQERFKAELAADPSFAQRLRSPFTPCTEKPQYYSDLPAGSVYINARAGEKMRPAVVKRTDLGLMALTDENEIYSGCIVVTTLSVFAYPRVGATGPKAANKGVSFGLGNVLKFADGERRSGRPTAEKDFGDLVKALPPGAATKPAEDIFGGGGGGLI